MKNAQLLYIFLAVILFSNASSAAPDKKTNGLEIGAKLPELTVTNQDGEKVPLTPADDNPLLLVFFYPKALTGG